MMRLGESQRRECQGLQFMRSPKHAGQGTGASRVGAWPGSSRGACACRCSAHKAACQASSMREATPRAMMDIRPIGGRHSKVCACPMKVIHLI